MVFVKFFFLKNTHLKVYSGKPEVSLNWEMCTMMNRNSTNPVMAILTWDLL
jgi:hypothetical protein